MVEVKIGMKCYRLVVNWYDLVLEVRDRYKLILAVIEWYELVLEVIDWYEMALDVIDWYEIILKVIDWLQSAMNWYLKLQIGMKCYRLVIALYEVVLEVIDWYGWYFKLWIGYRLCSHFNQNPDLMNTMRPGNFSLKR
nr:uncharacterized protein LOC113822467 [Penaeus vannamei]